MQRRLKITTPTSPVGGTPEHHLNSLRNWPVELHRRKWISTTAVWSWGNGLVRGKWESGRQCLKKVTDSRWRTIVPSRPLTVNKTFEQMLSKQVTGHYDPTLYQRMTAYRRHHSCQTTLLRLVEDWKSAVDRKELVYILTTDMSKAFDSLCHSLIVKKLEAYGFGKKFCQPSTNSELV